VRTHHVVCACAVIYDTHCTRAWRLSRASPIHQIKSLRINGLCACLFQIQTDRGNFEKNLSTHLCTCLDRVGGYIDHHEAMTTRALCTRSKQVSELNTIRKKSHKGWFKIRSALKV